MIHNFCKNIQAASGSKRTRFNAGINSGESELQVASLAAPPNEALCFWESLQIGTEGWAGPAPPTPCPLNNLEQHWSQRSEDMARVLLQVTVG